MSVNAINGVITIPGFLFMRKEVWMDEPEYSFQDVDVSKHGFALVSPYTIEHTIADGFNPIAAQVEALVLEKARDLS